MSLIDDLTKHEEMEALADRQHVWWSHLMSEIRKDEAFSWLPRNVAAEKLLLSELGGDPLAITLPALKRSLNTPDLKNRLGRTRPEDEKDKIISRIEDIIQRNLEKRTAQRIQTLKAQRPYASETQLRAELRSENERILQKQISEKKFMDVDALLQEEQRLLDAQRMAGMSADQLRQHIRKETATVEPTIAEQEDESMIVLSGRKTPTPIAEGLLRALPTPEVERIILKLGRGDKNVGMEKLNRILEDARLRRGLR